MHLQGIDYILTYIWIVLIVQSYVPFNYVLVDKVLKRTLLLDAETNLVPM